jgi:hypothetical protein
MVVASMEMRLYAVLPIRLISSILDADKILKNERPFVYLLKSGNA